jgi:hypothetical protein
MMSGFDILSFFPRFDLNEGKDLITSDISIVLPSSPAVFPNGFVANGCGEMWFSTFDRFRRDLLAVRDGTAPSARLYSSESCFDMTIGMVVGTPFVRGVIAHYREDVIAKPTEELITDHVRVMWPYVAKLEFFFPLATDCIAEAAESAQRIYDWASRELEVSLERQRRQVPPKTGA